MSLKGTNWRRNLVFTIFGRYKIGYICWSFEDFEAVESVESSSRAGEDISTEEDVKHLDTSNTIAKALEDVSHQDHASSMGQVAMESACIDQNQSASEEAAMVKSEVSEGNSSRQPTIVNQLLRDDK